MSKAYEYATITRESGKPDVIVVSAKHVDMPQAQIKASFAVIGKMTLKKAIEKAKVYADSVTDDVRRIGV